MKYLQKINEDKNSFTKQIKDLKSSPYKEFVPKLIGLVKSEDFQSNMGSLSPNENLGDEYGKFKMVNITADKLIPTQSQIGLKEVMSWLENTNSVAQIIVKGSAELFLNNRVLVANNKWIIDGHHRWSYVYMLNPKASIPCININIPNKKPVEILKDIQISIASTYQDLYTRQTIIENNLTQMEDKSFLPLVQKLLSEEEILLLRDAYGQTDFSKYILREFIIPDALLEEITIKNNDFIDREFQVDKEVDPEMKELDEIDNDNEDVTDLMQTGADYAGIIDPTGVVDVLNGMGYLYKGEYLLAICSFVSAVPLGDIVAKPVMGLLKSVAFKKITQYFAKALKSFDAKKAAEIWFEFEKKSPAFGEFLDFMLGSINKIMEIFQKILEKVGNHWLKFKLFYSVFSGKITKFFEDLFNWKKKLKDYLTKTSKSEVFGILSTNFVNIKRMIIDKSVDKMNVNFSIGPHPLQTALKVKSNPYGSDFKGVPTKLLNNLPLILPKIPSVEEVQYEEEKPKKIKDFVGFADNAYKDNSVKQPEVKPNVNTPVEPTDVLNKEVKEKDTKKQGLVKKTEKLPSDKGKKQKA